MDDGDLSGSVAVVTGGSGGIGRALVARLVEQGAEVIALARTKAVLDQVGETCGPRCIPMQCDLTSPSAVERVRDLVAERWGRLDSIIGNAAIMGPRTTLANLNETQWQDVISTNATSNWRLIRLFDPLLRKSKAGRAVFVTSGAGSRAQMASGRGAYAISKAALDALVRTYASETSDTRVRVMLCNPGPMRTALRASIAPEEDPLSLRTPEEFAPKVVAMCQPNWTVSGCLYDFPQDRLLKFNSPS
jgi:NAD(P)-dependent dehydrogenase (short-subunit alcohol dehydrogenase family)